MKQLYIDFYSFDNSNNFLIRKKNISYNSNSLEKEEEIIENIKQLKIKF